jgi:hypothetical protein
MWTVFATVTTGVVVLVVGRILQTFTLDPVNELRKVIGEVEANLLYYANLYGNLWTYEEVQNKLPAPTREKITKAEDLFRQLASRLSAAGASIVWYDVWEYTPWIPSRRAVHEAVGDLVLLSNSMYRQDRDTAIPREERNSTTANRIRSLLLLDGQSRPFWPHCCRTFQARRAARQARPSVAPGAES